MNIKPAKKTFQIFLFRLLISLILLLPPGLALAAPTASLDRQTISLDETVNLKIEIEGVTSSLADLDSQPLTDDFNILHQSSGSQIQMGGGQTRAVKSWDLELEAKRSGELLIPPLKVGGEETQALRLKVLPARSANRDNGAQVFLEIEPDMTYPPYVQSRLAVTVRLFIHEGLRLSEASLSEPELEKARLIKLGDDRSYRKDLGSNGSFRVIERRYAIIPEAAGSLTIPPLSFEGFAGNGRVDPFFGRLQNRGRRLRTRSQPLTIEVLPVPATFKGKNWLPAEKLSLMETEIPAEIKAGEPLTRKITIRARGLSAEQLPELDFRAPDGLRLYPDQAKLETQNDGLQLIGIRERSVAVIADRPGHYELPEIKIQWWDLKNDRPAVAQLPARTITVYPTAAPAAGQPPATATARTNPESKTQADSTKGEKSSPPPPLAKSLSRHQYFWPGLTGVFALLWMLTLMAWWRTCRRQKPAETAPSTNLRAPDSGLSASECRRRIIAAAMAGDPQASYKNMILWGTVLKPDTAPRNLRELAALFQNDEFSEECRKLEAVRFGPGEKWQGKELIRSLPARLPPAAPPAKTGTRLPPLYK